MLQNKIISLRVKPDFDRRLRIEAAKRDLDRSAFIRRTLAEKLAEIDRHEGQPQQQADGEAHHGDS